MNRLPLILVIEDNPADVQLLELALSEAGIAADLMTFADGANAMRWIASCGDPNPSGPCPDLAIVDLNLPKYDGLELLNALRRNSGLADVPALVMSSSTSPRDEGRVRSLPNTEYLAKPSDLDAYAEVGAVIARLLARATHGG
ncbi:MAG: response regulator [Bryobacterales bacterium]|nr:response regulator [Bryobacterales bacterium]